MQHFRRNRGVNAHIAKGNAVLVAEVADLGIADVTGAVSLIVVYSEPTSAVTASQQSNQQATTVTHRTWHHRPFHICVACDDGLVPIIRLPRDVAIMVVADHHLPFLPPPGDAVVVTTLRPPSNRAWVTVRPKT